MAVLPFNSQAVFMSNCSKRIPAKLHNTKTLNIVLCLMSLGNNMDLCLKLIIQHDYCSLVKSQTKLVPYSQVPSPEGHWRHSAYPAHSAWELLTQSPNEPAKPNQAIQNVANSKIPLPVSSSYLSVQTHLPRSMQCVWCSYINLVPGDRHQQGKKLHAWKGMSHAGAPHETGQMLSAQVQHEDAGDLQAPAVSLCHQTYKT